MHSTMSPFDSQPVAPENFAAHFDVSSSPFCLELIRITSERLRCKLEAASLTARLKASELANVELFCLLAQNAAEALPASWAAVYDMVAAEERFWVYPKMTLGDIEDGACEAFAPYLDRARLASEWHQLLEHVQRVISAQKSAKQHALTA